MLKKYLGINITFKSIYILYYVPKFLNYILSSFVYLLMNAFMPQNCPATGLPTNKCYK